MTTPETTSAAAPATDPTPKAKGAPKRGTSARRGTAGGGPTEPKAPPASKGRAPRPPGRPSAKAKRAEAVAGLYVSAGLGLDITGNLTGSPAIAADGRAVTAIATAAGEAWAEVAEANPAVARVLDNLTTSNAWGALLMAHVPLVLGLVQNHTPPARPKAPTAPPASSPASAAAATSAAAAATAEPDAEPPPGAEVVAAVLGLAAGTSPAPSPIAVA